MTLSFFVSDAFADDWRMRKFDANEDGFVVVSELKSKGCVVKPGLFKHADKNKDGKISGADFAMMKKKKKKKRTKAMGGGIMKKRMRRGGKVI